MVIFAKEVFGELTFEGDERKVSKYLKEFLEKETHCCRVLNYFLLNVSKYLIHVVCQEKNDVVGVEHEILLQVILLIELKDFWKEDVF